MTAQAGAILIVHGIETRMAFCPLLLDLHHPRLRKLSQQEMKERRVRHFQAHDAGENKLSDGDAIAATLLSGDCVATWEIRDNKLYLAAIGNPYELTGDGPLLADWFTGTLRVPSGHVVHYAPIEFGTVYERELRIEIERGLVTGWRSCDNHHPSFGSYVPAAAYLPGEEDRFLGRSRYGLVPGFF
jgi:hypothetical protein